MTAAYLWAAGEAANVVDAAALKDVRHGNDKASLRELVRHGLHSARGEACTANRKPSSRHDMQR